MNYSVFVFHLVISVGKTENIFYFYQNMFLSSALWLCQSLEICMALYVFRGSSRFRIRKTVLSFFFLNLFYLLIYEERILLLPDLINCFFNYCIGLLTMKTVLFL